MSTVESALITLVQSNISWYFGQKSLFVDMTKSPIASLAIGQFAKIYSAAKKSNTSLRFAFDLTETTATKILNTSVKGSGPGKPRTVEEDTVYSFVVSELINVLCPQELRDVNKREAYFYYGIKMMGSFITQNAPKCIQDCEVARLVKTTVQRPQGTKLYDNEHEECKQLVVDIAHVLWDTAHGKIASEIGVYAPSKFLHATLEGTQSLTNSLTAQFISASGFFTTMANSVADEAKSIAKMFTETSEQAVSTVTEAVKEAQGQIASMVMPQSLTEFVKASSEGMELFTEYFWTSKPSVWDFAWELPEANHAILNDDDLHLLLMNQQGPRRRPILHAGER